MNNLSASDIGFSQINLDEIKRILTQFTASNQKLDVFVFGSRARGDYKKYSDLDLLLIAEPEITPSTTQAMIDAFDESDLPVKVDVVRYEDILESFKTNIQRDKKLLFSLIK